MDSQWNRTPQQSGSPSTTMVRLWRPQAQRNLRNQWSKLFSLHHQWLSSSSSHARSIATSLVNSYLSLIYMDSRDFGVLSDMPNIRRKACFKLLKQLDLQRSQLLSSYKAMVAIVVDLVNSSKSMRCYSKATLGSPLLQFSSNSEDSNDTGDGGGVPVFTIFPISTFETLAEELVGMFKLELLLKRLIVVEILSLSCQKVEQLDPLSWEKELYDGEANDLMKCNLYSKECSEPFLPKLNGWRQTSSLDPDRQPSHEVLQVYLTTWLVEVNIDTSRVEEIFAIIGEEMRISFS